MALIPTKEVAWRAGTTPDNVTKAARGKYLKPPIVSGQQGKGSALFDEADVEEWIKSRNSRGFYATGLGFPGNPWGGLDAHAECESSRWTLPYDGHLDSSLWVCLNHPRTVFYRREPLDEYRKS